MIQAVRSQGRATTLESHHAAAVAIMGMSGSRKREYTTSYSSINPR